MQTKKHIFAPNKTMFHQKRFSSFMISDILKCDKVEDSQNLLNNQISSTDYSLLHSYINNSNDLSPYISSQNRYLWTHALDQNLVKVGCQQPTADTILWQHYLLKQRMLMQAKPRKGGQIRFTTEQSVTLEKQFDHQKYLSPPERKKIATQLGLTERQIKTWFQNRRAKWRRCKQFNEDREQDKNIFYNKYEDTHKATPDKHNDDECDNIENYEFQNSHNQDSIRVGFRLLNFA